MAYITYRDPLNSPMLDVEDHRMLQVLYGAEDRFYHNLAHVGHTANYTRKIFHKYAASTATVYEARMLTVSDITGLFHDAIYNIGSVTNEADSADLFEQSQTYQNVDSGYRPIILQTIIASSDHTNPKWEKTDFLVRAFLDADLYELGSPYFLFEHNYNNIVKEYLTKYTLEEVLKGRCAWYRSMLEKPQIYWLCTDREDQARANMQAHLTKIEQEIEWNAS